MKSVSENGSFSGLASVFGNVDLGGDVVVAGAFSKSLADRGSEIPILWQHDARQPIGLGKLKETNSGLLIEGQLVMSVARAKEAYDLMKARVLKGLSIGFDTVKSDMQAGIRYLKELKLFEVSLVSIPMNPAAQILTVKIGNLDAQISDLAQLVRDCRESWRK